MPSHQECKYLPYTSQQLFELVADVEKYPEFLPWCLACKIMKKKPEFIEANMIVGFKMVKERFMTRVYLKREEFIIDIEYLNGPFEYLENRWRFIAEENGGCNLDFDIRYQFRSSLLQTLSAIFFTEAMRKLTNAFENRAYQLYHQKHLK